jgi:hypothetical protein
VGDACGANARLQQRSGGRILHASCNMHARREFIEAEANNPVLASQAISFYRQLYDVEERGKTLDATARQQLRQRDAVPIWNRMRLWLDSNPVKRVLPRSRIGEALGYLRNQWSALTLYLGDGRIPIDNGQSEQIIRPLTVGRNYADFRAMRSGRWSGWHLPALRCLKLRIFRHSPSRKSSRSSAFLRRPFLTGGSSSLSSTRRFISKSASTYW